MYTCQYEEGDGVLPDPYLLASIGADKARWPSLLGSPVFVARHAYLTVTQAKKGDKNQIPVA